MCQVQQNSEMSRFKRMFVIFDFKPIFDKENVELCKNGFEKQYAAAVECVVRTVCFKMI